MQAKYAAYTDHFLRAFKQAPWRTQTQAVAAWSITLLIIAVLGGLYLSVASRAGTAGRDLQDYQARKAELIIENDELRATYAQLTSVTRLANRARELGYAPAQAEQIEYLAVPNYPQPANVTASVPAEPVQAITLGEWLLKTVQRWMTGQGG